MQQPLKRQAGGLTAHHADVIPRETGNRGAGKPGSREPRSREPRSREPRNREAGSREAANRKAGNRDTSEPGSQKTLNPQHCLQSLDES